MAGPGGDGGSRLRGIEGLLVDWVGVGHGEEWWEHRWMVRRRGTVEVVGVGRVGEVRSLGILLAVGSTACVGVRVESVK